MLDMIELNRFTMVPVVVTAFTMVHARGEALGKSGIWACLLWPHTSTIVVNCAIAEIRCDNECDNAWMFTVSSRIDEVVEQRLGDWAARWMSCKATPAPNCTTIC